MRFDGKITRQRAKAFKLTELSGVTVPAHEGADVTIIKTADLVKTAFEQALLERKLENAQWPLTEALREAMEKIVEDPTIGDKLLAMREAALQYVDALIAAVNKGESPEQPEEATTMADVEKLKRLEAIVALKAEHRAHFDTLKGEEADAFLAAEDKDSVIAVSKAMDETHTLVTGVVITKAKAGDLFDVLKAQDVETRKLREEADVRKYTDMAKELIPNVSCEGGDVAKAKVLKGVHALPEAERGALLSMLKQANDLGTKRDEPLVTGGRGPTEPEQQLDAMVKAHQQKVGGTYETAYAEVTKSGEGRELLLKTRAKE